MIPGHLVFSNELHLSNGLLNYNRLSRLFVGIKQYSFVGKRSLSVNKVFNF